jgi:hypothetical protein
MSQHVTIHKNLQRDANKFIFSPNVKLFNRNFGINFHKNRKIHKRKSKQEIGSLHIIQDSTIVLEPIK